VGVETDTSLKPESYKEYGGLVTREEYQPSNIYTISGSQTWLHIRITSELTNKYITKEQVAEAIPSRLI
jgi:hypothetical protein